MKLKIKQLDKSLPLPEYKTEHSAGMDLYSAEDVVLKSGEHKVVKSGIAVEIPVGYELQVRARSGLAAKNGIGLVNGIGTIDADYRGEIGIILYNYSNQDFVIEKGMRIAQAVITKYEKAEVESVEELSETERGTGGLGSTGVK